MVTWPVFSVASFLVVRALARQGIVPCSVIDVGANIGQFALAAAYAFPEADVYSFEPLPTAAAALRRNVAQKRVTVYETAVGSHEGVATLMVNAHSHASSLLRISPNHTAAFPHAKETHSVQVSVTTLDQALLGRDLRAPVLLKIDTQGSEHAVLEGAKSLLPRCEFVLLEVSFRSMYIGEKLFEDHLQTMRSNGFRFLRPIDLLADPSSGEIIQADVLFVRSDA